MRRTIVECVPNFSEGRDPEKVTAIASAIASVPGVALLGKTMDCDHNRSVITFAGRQQSVLDAAFAGIELAASLIDLNEHAGVHPRLGAADVVPFVPVEGITLEDSASLAVHLGQHVWSVLRIPVYLYGAAARRPERAALENIRRGGFERVREEALTNPDRYPDIGETPLHPTAGAVIIGARKFLIAFNVNLNTSDLQVAREIARKIRASSGGLPFVKALGLPLDSRKIVQVSMNLTDFEQTPPHVVFEVVASEAAARGVGVAGSEIVGLVPRKALTMFAPDPDVTARHLRLERFEPNMILENNLAVFE